VRFLPLEREDGGTSIYGGNHELTSGQSWSVFYEHVEKDAVKTFLIGF